MSGASDQRASETVRQAVIHVCRTAFHWRDDVRSIFIDAGVPEAMYDRFDHPETSKAKIARHVLNDLRQLGARGVAIERKIVEELCRWDTPHPDAEDPKAGQAALQALKRAATANQILIDPDKAAAKQRRARAEQQLRAQQRRQERLGSLRDCFYELLRERPRTPAELQQRGYRFESVLVELFAAHDIDYRPPYRIPREQVDGSFHFRGFSYITEAKWESTAPTLGDLAKFRFKVDSKMDSTRGFFVSMAGYDEAVIEHVFRGGSATRNNVILVDDKDMITIFEGRMALTDALLAKVDAAEQEGTPWHPLCR